MTPAQLSAWIDDIRRRAEALRDEMIESNEDAKRRCQEIRGRWEKERNRDENHTGG